MLSIEYGLVIYGKDLTSIVRDNPVLYGKKLEFHIYNREIIFMSWGPLSDESPTELSKIAKKPKRALQVEAYLLPRYKGICLEWAIIPAYR